MPTVLGTGMLVAAAVALLVEACGLLAPTVMRPVAGSAVLLIQAWNRLTPHQRAGDGTHQSQSPRWAVKRAGIAMTWAATAGLAVSATVPAGHGPVPPPTPQQIRSAVAALRATPVIPEVRCEQTDARLKYGGLDLITRFFQHDEGQLDAVADSADPAKIGPVCAEFSQAPQLANAYFPVPDPVLQKRWSMLITYIGQVGVGCLRGVKQKNTNLFITSVIKLIKIDTQANPVAEAIVAEGKPQ